MKKNKFNYNYIKGNGINVTIPKAKVIKKRFLMNNKELRSKKILLFLFDYRRLLALLKVYESKFSDLKSLCLSLYMLYYL